MLWLTGASQGHAWPTLTLRRRPIMCNLVQYKHKCIHKNKHHTKARVFLFLLWIIYIWDDCFIKEFETTGQHQSLLVSSCLLSKEKELSRLSKHQTQNLLHLDYLRTYLVTMRILFLLIIRRCTEYRHYSFQSQSPIDCRINWLFCITLKEQNVFDPPLFCNVLGQSCWEHQSQVGLDVGPPSPCVLFHSCQIVSSKGLTLGMQVIIFDVDVRFKLARALACL